MARGWARLGKVARGCTRWRGVGKVARAEVEQGGVDRTENSIKLHYDVPGDDYTRAGEASAQVKQVLRKLGLLPQIIRRVSIAMYEGEINMSIHANGGEIDVEIGPADISITLRDTGPGIEDIDLAMKEGFSTATEKVRSMGFGAGMGLPNIKKHSNHLKIDSTPGVGTTLYIRITISEEIIDDR